WHFDEKALKAAFNKRTKLVVVNTPSNPLGKVFAPEELAVIAKLCDKWNSYALSDELYEHLVFDGRKHASIASLPGMQERTIILGGASKTYSVTGWRIGWVLAPEKLTNDIRKVHDFLTIGPAAPLQDAVAQAARWDDPYYADLAAKYEA